MTEPANPPGEKQPNARLADFFARINMSELPAMSDHVRELIALTHSSRSAAFDIAKVILKDYSLTNKVLQVVNSAFYSLGRTISSISSAVTVLGFDAVRDLATAIALFEDFIKAGAEKDTISQILTRAFLSAVQAKELAVKKHLRVYPEEAFICSLLHSLGKIMVCIHAPDMYREIERKVAEGQREEAAAREVFGNFTYQELGEEIAKFWNLGEKITDSMNPDPPKPTGPGDANAMLQNVSSFTNALINNICDAKDIGPLMAKYGNILTVNPEEMIQSVMESVENSEDISDAIRYGLSKLKIRSKVKTIQRNAGKPGTPAQSGEPEEETVPPNTSPEATGEEELDELPLCKDKSINDYIHDLTEMLMGKFNLNDFYANLLEALYRGVGFDRVILGILSIQPTQIVLVGRFGLGDIDTSKTKIEHPVGDTTYAVSMALKAGKDMVIPPEKTHAFPENLRFLVKDRMVYLFPIIIDKKPIGLLYLDRKKARPLLDQNNIKSVRLLRDFAVMAIRKIRKK